MYDPVNVLDLCDLHGFLYSESKEQGKPKEKERKEKETAKNKGKKQSEQCGKTAACSSAQHDGSLRNMEDVRLKHETRAMIR